MSFKRTFLREKERVWLALVVAFFAFSILRGIRFPNLWAASHFYFNYDPGFLKRGFTGAIVRWLDWDFLYNYSFFFYLSFIIFAANMAILLNLTLRLAKDESPVIKASALIFSTSFGIVFLAHTMGYPEQIHLLAVLLLVRIRSFPLKVALALPASVIMILIHESYLLTFFPVLILSILVGHGNIRPLVRWQMAGFFFLFLLLFSWVVNRQIIDERGMISMLGFLHGRVDFPIRADALGTLFRSAADNISIMKSIWKGPYYLKHQIVSMALTLPSILYFLYAAISNLVKREKPQIACAIVISSLAPFSLHLFGWDVHRFNTLTITTSFLSLAVVMSTPYFGAGGAPEGRGKWLAAGLAALILVMNCSQKIPLFDNREVQSIPFRSHIEYLSKVVKGEASFPEMPDR